MNLFKKPTPQQASQHLQRYFEKLQRKAAERPLQILVSAPNLGLDFHYPSGSTGQPFHLASIGKVFTATLVHQLANRGALSLDDPLAGYFNADLLANLFVYRGVDYASRATIGQLLAHTAGVADYFEDRTLNKSSFLDEVLNNPDQHWTPQALLDFTRHNQAAVGIPGKTYHYSDTGYILLGLLIEKVTAKPFHQNLEEAFFRPLGMDDSYLMFYGEPRNPAKPPIQPIWLNKKEVSRFTSLSCDWAGGGIVSTTADLLKFNRALRDGELVPPTTLSAMDHCTNKFQPGIYYGSGMMEIRFGEFFFLLGGLPKVKGHIGILATHMFYDPRHQAHIVMNFGDNTRMVESFQALIEIENTLARIA